MVASIVRLCAAQRPAATHYLRAKACWAGATAAAVRAQVETARPIHGRWGDRAESRCSPETSRQAPDSVTAGRRRREKDPLVWTDARYDCAQQTLRSVCIPGPLSVAKSKFKSVTCVSGRLIYLAIEQKLSRRRTKYISASNKICLGVAVFLSRRRGNIASAARQPIPPTAPTILSSSARSPQPSPSYTLPCLPHSDGSLMH